MKEWIKKYGWLLLLVIVIAVAPIIINWAILQPQQFSIIGDGTHWLGFWATYISAMASFAMVLVTLKTLRQNKISLNQNDKLLQQNNEQLNELKRQWEEEHKPKLSCSLFAGRKEVYIRIVNYSPTTADNVKVHISNHSGKEIFHFEQTQKYLKDTILVIESFGVKNIKIYVEPYIDGKYEGYIEVLITNNSDTFGPYKLQLKEINLISTPAAQPELLNLLDDIKGVIKNIKII